MTKRKSINVTMSDEEIKAYREAKGDRTHRENLLTGAGVRFEEKPRGRPRFKFDRPERTKGFKFDRKMRNIRCENCGLVYQSSSSPGGGICTRCKFNSSELKKNWRRITCQVCGTKYSTSRARGASKCYACENINSEIEEFTWKQAKKGVTRGKYDSDDLVEEEYQGNAAPMTLSKYAQMYFSIPEEIWEGLSEKEKVDYILRLPPRKKRAGEEEMSDRDFANAYLTNTGRRDFNPRRAEA